MKFRIGLLAITVLLGINIGVSAQSTSPVEAKAYLCSNFEAVTYARSPDWKVESDGYGGQSVLLHFKNKDVSSVGWIKNNETYYSANGIGVPMSSGFSISVLGESYVETYVFSAGSSQLIYTKIRSGDDQLPNAILTAIAQCDGAGKLVK